MSLGQNTLFALYPEAQKHHEYELSGAALRLYDLCNDDADLAMAVEQALSWLAHAMLREGDVMRPLAHATRVLSGHWAFRMSVRDRGTDRQELCYWQAERWQHEPPASLAGRPALLLERTRSEVTPPTLLKDLNDLRGDQAVNALGEVLTWLEWHSAYDQTLDEDAPRHSAPWMVCLGMAAFTSNPKMRGLGLRARPAKRRQMATGLTVDEEVTAEQPWLPAEQWPTLADALKVHFF